MVKVKARTLTLGDGFRFGVGMLLAQAAFISVLLVSAVIAIIL